MLIRLCNCVTVSNNTLIITVVISEITVRFESFPTSDLQCTILGPISLLQIIKGRELRQFYWNHLIQYDK